MFANAPLQFHKLATSLSIPKAKAEVTRIVHALGFDFWSYSHVDFVHFNHPEVLMLGELPASWLELYERNHYKLVDPVIKQGLSSSKPFIWSPELFDQSPVFFQQARVCGLVVGLSQSIRLVNTAAVGVFSLARIAGTISEAEIEAKQSDMHWLAHLLHSRVARFSKKPLELKDKERVIMRWTADGKSVGDIATILDIKERSVTFHINNVMAKLGVQNKTAATVYLAMRGALF
jgi:LuxR family transcriptional regulator, quorum-sensing system regulator SolR